MRFIRRICPLILLVATAFGQQAFEVFSVKPSPPPVAGRGGGGRGAGTDPLRLSTHNAPLQMLVRLAYNVQYFQVSGGPAWAETERWDVDAKAEHPSTPEQMMAMLRGAIADRFQLQVHRETRQISLGALVVAKDGPKLGPAFHPVEEDSTGSGGQAAGHWQYRCTLQQFAAQMAPLLRASLSGDPDAFDKPMSADDAIPIIDQTGLTGVYAITLTPKGIDWLGVLQGELGLKLERRKAAMEVLIIDNATKPEVE